MKSLYMTTIMLNTLLVSTLFWGCGSTSDEGGQTQAPQNENNGSGNSGTNPVVAGYSAGSGILIETRSDGTKRAWVNTTGTQCLIYRLSQHPGTTILDGGNAYCQGLVYAGIDSWRMPTEEEAVYLMAHVPVNTAADQSSVATSNKDANFIIYPNDNPDCRFMATTSSVAGNEGRYVYTTNSTSANAALKGAFNNFDVQGKERTTAGIRCVADQ